MIAPRTTGTEASSGAVNVLAALLRARTGQEIAANRTWRIDTALKPLIAERGLETVDQLVALVLEARDPAIGDRVVDALLNQETSFFRDAGVIEATAAAIVETAAATPGRRPRLWSAGCASGQEALSLAMIFVEASEADSRIMPEIIATDVSEAALLRGRAGRYNQFEIQRGLPVRRMMRWFDSVDGDWVAKPELVKRVSFRRQNLVADRAPIGPFDAVLCRNVLFYLAPALRGVVLARIADVLRPGGLLVLGAGETVIGQTDRFQPSKRYRGLYEPATANTTLAERCI